MVITVLQSENIMVNYYHFCKILRYDCTVRRSCVLRSMLCI